MAPSCHDEIQSLQVRPAGAVCEPLDVLLPGAGSSVHRCGYIRHDRLSLSWPGCALLYPLCPCVNCSEEQKRVRHVSVNQSTRRDTSQQPAPGSPAKDEAWLSLAVLRDDCWQVIIEPLLKQKVCFALGEQQQFLQTHRQQKQESTYDCARCHCTFAYPLTTVVSFTGRVSSPNTNVPSGGTLSHSATSPIFWIVAEIAK